MNVTTTINIHAAKTHLSRLAEEAAQGDIIIIAKNGKPIAKLVGLGDTGPTLPRIGFGLAYATGTGPATLEAFNADDGEIAALFEGDA
jgi:prevent-host-death family protein